MPRPLLLALALLATADAAAQPALVVSTDTLRYPAETTFTAMNAGADSLALSFPLTHEEPEFYGTTGTYEWAFEVETPDSLYYVYLPFDEPPPIPLGPSASAAFRVKWLDPCPLCAVEGSEGDFPADTLYLRGADASGVDTARVVLDLAGYVSAEPAAPTAAPLHVSAYPNPAREGVTVGLALEGPAEVRVSVMDVLGREVAVLHAGPLAAGEHALTLGTKSLAPGPYVVRATAGAVRLSRRFTVLR